MPEATHDADPGSIPVPPSPGPAARRRTVLLAGGAVVAAVALGAGLKTWGSDGGRHREATADGLRHTTIDVTPAGCGRGWTRPEPGRQVFALHNASSTAAEAYLTDPRTGAVYGEVEGLGPGTVRPLRVTLGNGTYAFRCLPDDANAVTGPTVRITGSTVKSGPAAVPVSQQDLIPPTLAYQKWIQARTVELVQKTDVLRDAVDRGDLTAARAAWLPAHLVYERMGAAYGTFGDADSAINGTTAGLSGGLRDPGFAGFHRVDHRAVEAEPSAQSSHLRKPGAGKASPRSSARITERMFDSPRPHGCPAPLVHRARASLFLRHGKGTRRGCPCGHRLRAPSSTGGSSDSVPA
ncbi:imelysin family protein [Streptomyces canus]|uniref:imelysin family protein n=1 Tax=Streptomyces canus TaxID=58343 RepID=UPI00224F140F|nr:imelysin family protein [Streptomyces canus]MCX4857536.1 hypothetical protein [Streptomyces canus]